MYEIRLIDATSGQVPAGTPTILVDGAQVWVWCLYDAGSGPCPFLSGNVRGQHTLTISVPGYRTASVQVDVEPMGSSCCPSYGSTSVTLHPT